MLKRKQCLYPWLQVKHLFLQLDVFLDKAVDDADPLKPILRLDEDLDAVFVDL